MADQAYQGAGSAFRIPYYGHRELRGHCKRFNRVHARLRTPKERVFARLKIWRVLRRSRCSTSRVSGVVQAVRTLLTCSCSGWKSFDNSVIFFPRYRLNIALCSPCYRDESYCLFGYLYLISH
ncbi:transposase family protein [Streptomyces sp. x-80]|uniref:transposase family protein n=1 Tax=Streptomyces sp. x-80 TaxID=2789282 RepID=UPI00397FC7FF